ncbi:MAG: hypothetical protein WAW20_18215, partial [Anaerolineae bacterium]
REMIGILQRQIGALEKHRAGHMAGSDPTKCIERKCFWLTKGSGEFPLIARIQKTTSHGT